MKGRGKEMRKRPRLGATRAMAIFLFETKKELKEREKERFSVLEFLSDRQGQKECQGLD